MGEEHRGGQAEYNWARVASEGLEYVFRLVDSGRIVLVVILVCLLKAFVAVLRMDPKALGQVALVFVNVARSRLLCAGVPTAIAVFIFYLWRSERKVNLREIERLGKEKSRYAHEAPIPEHRSSQYIWPDEEPEE